MTPTKIALFGCNEKLRRAIKDLALSQIEIVPKQFSNDHGFEDFSLAVLHHVPPIQNALEKIGAMKRANPDLPIIIMAEGPSEHDIVEAFRMGANDFLFFPLQKETLENCLHRFDHEMTNRHPKRWWQRWLLKLSQPKPKPQLSHSLGIVAPMAARSPALEELHATEPYLSIQLLGKFTLIANGKVLPRLPGKKAKSLLAYLFYHYPRPVHRDLLIDCFWPDSTTGSARNCLNVTLHTIRRCFEELEQGKNFIEYRDECYSFPADLNIDRDIDQFKSYWKKAQLIEQTQGMEAAVDSYHQAFAFYRGDFLEDLRYEEWAERGRDKYKEILLVILDRLTSHFFDKERYQICQTLCQQMLEKDACLEDVHRKLMECFVELGMPDLAIRQFHKCRDILKKELNVPPGKATWELFLSIRDA